MMLEGSNQEKFELDCAGHRISGWRLGDASLPPIVALHGWLDNANSFIPLASRLKDKYCVYAVDLPGHGLSSHNPEHAYYHIWDGVDIIYQIMNALELESPYLLGHSMGGGMASLFAGTFPERLTGLILIEAMGPLSDKDEDAPTQLRKSIESRHGVLAEARRFPSFSLAAEARQKGMLPVSEQAANLLAERGVSAKADKQYVWHADQKLKLPSSLRLTEGQVRSFLKNISVPTYLFLGEKGMLNGYPLEDRMACVEHLNVFRLSGDHHLHMEEDSEKIADVLVSIQ